MILIPTIDPRCKKVFLLIVIHVRQELKNEDEIDKFLQNISKMKTCKGFPEKDVKPGKFV